MLFAGRTFSADALRGLRQPSHKTQYDSETVTLSISDIPTLIDFKIIFCPGADEKQFCWCRSLITIHPKVWIEEMHLWILSSKLVQEIKPRILNKSTCITQHMKQQKQSCITQHIKPNKSCKITFNKTHKTTQTKQHNKTYQTKQIKLHDIRHKKSITQHIKNTNKAA